MLIPNQQSGDKQVRFSYPVDMQTSIELPDTIYQQGERLARVRGYTLEQLIVRALERELSQEEVSSPSPDRVSLSLIHSKNPGTLDLTKFDFDDLLA